MIPFAVLIIAVVLIALVARSGSKVRQRSPADDRAWLAGDDGSVRQPSPDPPVAELAGRVVDAVTESARPEGAHAPDEESDTSGEPAGAEPGEEEAGALNFFVPTTTDGWDFIWHHGRLQLVMHRVTRIDPGAIVAARVRPDETAPGLWMVEALEQSVDSDTGAHWPYRAWAFASESAAGAALRLLERVIRPQLDEYGEPRVFTDADFDKARRITIMEEPEFDSEPADTKSNPRGSAV